MKTTFKQAAIGLVALALLATAPLSFASPTLSYTTTNYGAVVNDPFGGFDWNSAGSAVVTGYVPDGTTVFNTEFWADAVNVKSTGGATLLAPLTAAGFPNGAEFTIQAFIQETAVATSATSADFTAVGGSFNIWYQPLANANLVTGAGITDGILIMSGTILADVNVGDAGSFNATTTGGTGNFTFNTTVDYTNNAYINPDLINSEAVSTLQFGSSTTAWTTPTSTPSGAIPGGAIVFQADANHAFGAAPNIPEPGILALVSLGLFGLAGLRRRLS